MADFDSCDAELAATLTRLYPCLADSPPPGWLSDLAALRAPLQLPAGSTLFSPGTRCQGFPLLLDGEVRVAVRAADGRELELYRVSAGEVCVVSAMSLYAETAMEGYGATSAPTRLVRLPPEVFMRWTASEGFRRFVFGVFAARMAELAQLVEAVAFQRLDQRLAAALIGHGPSFHITHQALADELGTVREVVSRLLQRFERAGWVALTRERVDICDAAALRQLASSYQLKAGLVMPVTDTG